MTSFGETLRRERLKRNLELGKIAEELKISSRFLEAIEAGQLDKLPGGVFTKSFILQYARLLGLDEEQIAGEVQRMLEPPPPEVPEFVETPKPEDSGIRVPRVEEWQAVGGSGFRWVASLAAAALVIAVMLVCSVLYTWWQHARHPAAARESPPVAAVQPPPQTPPVQPSPPLPAPSPAAPGEAAPALTVARNPAAQPVSGASAPAPSTEQPAPPATPPGPEGTPPSAPVAGTSESNPNAPVRVEVTADEPVWVQARRDGKYVFSGTLTGRQSRTIEANSTVILRLGNAGGVTITLNGKPVGPVGPRGQVRTVQFTSGGFEIVAVPKPPAPLDPL
ncbi:MAG: helix-turn-helix domain-containing protein [Bryobacteraceae bacterium]|jgi:cytoskeleton protein RodZ